MVRRIGSAVLATVLLSACDIPTELPKWDTTWVVKSESTIVSIDQLLPGPSLVTTGCVAGTSCTPAFSLRLNPATFSQSLGSLCAACAALNGQTAPKPAFTGSFSTTLSLPSDVAGAALLSGVLLLRVLNGFSFDPLNPSATTSGTISVTVTSGGITVGTGGVIGSTTFPRAALPPRGGILDFSIPLNASTISGPLTVTVTVNSPVGDPAQINTSDALSVTATPSNLLVSSAQVRVQNRNITAVSVQLDVNDIDSVITDHIKSGSLLLTINNPFAVSGTLTLTITGGTQPISKPVAVAAGQTTVEVPFTASELRSFVGLGAGHNITLSITGPVTAAAPVTVTPTQVLSVSSQLKLVIGPRD